jgi:hypothetical protein
MIRIAKAQTMSKRTRNLIIVLAICVLIAGAAYLAIAYQRDYDAMMLTIEAMD